MIRLKMHAMYDHFPEHNDKFLRKGHQFSVTEARANELIEKRLVRRV